MSSILPGVSRARRALAFSCGISLAIAQAPALAQTATPDAPAAATPAPDAPAAAPATDASATASQNAAPPDTVVLSNNVPPGTVPPTSAHPSAGEAVRATPARLWRTGWRSVTTLEFGLATGLGVTAVGVSFLMPANPGRHFQGGWLFDNAVRDAFRADTASGRRTAATASDALLYAFIGAPYVQAAVSAWIARDEPRTAFQLSLISTEAYAATWAVMWAFKAFMGRERPFVTANRQQHGCDTATPDDPNACTSTGDDNASFLSGHSAFSFTSAGLLCSHGMYLGLGSTRWDIGLCAGAMAAAATTATLRVVADVHYATDIIAGSILGLLNGLIIPGLYHFHGTVIEEPPSVDRHAERSYAPRSLQILPLVFQQGGGLAVSGLVL